MVTYCYSTAVNVWDGWTSTSTTSSTTDNVWYLWTSATDTSTTASINYLNYTWNSWNERVTDKHDDRERRRARMAQALIEQKDREQQAKDAEVTATELLGELIGEEQAAVYKETGRLFVKGRRHDYMLYKDGRVRRIEKNRIVDLCIHHKYTGERLPATDKVIGMKLAIEADQKGFDREANDQHSFPRSKLPKAACM